MKILDDLLNELTKQVIINFQKLWTLNRIWIWWEITEPYQRYQQEGTKVELEKMSTDICCWLIKGLIYYSGLHNHNHNQITMLVLLVLDPPCKDTTVIFLNHPTTVSNTILHLDVSKKSAFYRIVFIMVWKESFIV